MGALCGWVGHGSPASLSAMLDAVPYRGAEIATHEVEDFAVGIRHDPGEASLGSDNGSKQFFARVGEAFGPTGPLPPSALFEANGYRHVDGAFSAFCHDPEALCTRLVRDPFGIAPLFYAPRGDALYFATELKQLLAVGSISPEIDHAALHEYLTFSFLPSFLPSIQPYTDRGSESPPCGRRRRLEGRIVCRGTALFRR